MASREQIKGTIRHRRLALGDSQETAAATVGVQRLQWIRWEKGTNVPSNEHRDALASYLNISPLALMLDPDLSTDDPLTRHIRAIVRQELERAQREMKYATA